MAKSTMSTLTANENGAIIEMQDLSEVAMQVSRLQKRYEIKKAKLKDIALEVEFSESLDDSTNTVKKDCTAAVHQDLKDAFQRMNIILLEITEQPDESKVDCTGFVIGKDGNGATLIGLRELSTGKGLNLTSPYEKFDDNGDLEHAINVAKQEVLLYLFEGKHAPDAQLSLFDAEDTFAEEEL